MTVNSLTRLSASKGFSAKLAAGGPECWVPFASVSLDLDEVGGVVSVDSVATVKVPEGDGVVAGIALVVGCGRRPPSRSPGKWNAVLCRLGLEEPLRWWDSTILVARAEGVLRLSRSEAFKVLGQGLRVWAVFMARSELADCLVEVMPGASIGFQVVSPARA